MANASISGVKCPICGERVTVRVNAYGGSPGYSGIGSYDGVGHPGDPPEIEEVEEILFEDCEHDIPSGPSDVNYTAEAEVKSFWDSINSQIDKGEIEWDEVDPPEPEPYGEGV